MTRGPRTSAPSRPQRDTAANNNSAGPQLWQFGGADGARPENGMHLRREYILLAPEVPEGGPANAGARVRGDGHGTTRGTADKERTETDTGDKTRHRALLAHGMQEDGDEERCPPNRLRTLHARGHQGGGGGGCLRRAARCRRGIPIHGSARPKRAAAGWGRRGDPPPISARNPHAGRGAREPPQLGSALPQRAARGKRRKGTSPNYSVCTSHVGGVEREKPRPGSARDPTYV